MFGSDPAQAAPAAAALPGPDHGVEHLTYAARFRWRWLERRLRRTSRDCKYILCDNALPETPVKRKYCSEVCVGDHHLWRAEILMLHPCLTA